MFRFRFFIHFTDTRFENPAVSALKDVLDTANTGKAVPVVGGVTGEIVVENIDAGYYVLGCTQYPFSWDCSRICCRNCSFLSRSM